MEGTQVERRTGIKGWCAQPGDARLSVPETVVPPRWKQMVSIFVGVLAPQEALREPAAELLVGSPLPGPGEGHLNQTVLDACAEPRLGRRRGSPHNLSATQREGTPMPRTDNAGLPAFFNPALVEGP